jgi:hypothetical protein
VEIVEKRVTNGVTAKVLKPAEKGNAELQNYGVGI